LETLFQTNNLVFGGLIPYGNLSIPIGRITFITGESGSGKTSLFKLLNGVLSPSRGSVCYRGQDVQALCPELHRREVSLVAQEPYLFAGSIRDNYNAFYEYRELPAPPDDAIQTFLSHFHLNFTPESGTQTLSGGEKQRLYLAIFLSFKPGVLLLDEPTSALDAATGEIVLANTIQFCRENGMELVVISHNTDLAAKFSQNTLTLKRQAVI
jgi:putative ABC transport system ATP-binding protein